MIHSDAQRRAMFAAMQEAQLMPSDFKYYLGKDNKAHRLSRQLTMEDLQKFPPTLTMDEIKLIEDYSIVPTRLLLRLDDVTEEE